MYLAPEGQEVEIAQAAAACLADAIPLTRLHRAGSADLPPPLRARIGALGWFALALPEPDGGSGLSAVEHALFFREVGCQCGPVDLLAQCLGATVASGALRDALMAGEAGIALAVADGPQWRLLGAPDADHALCVAPQEARIVPLTGIDAQARAPLDPVNSLRLIAAGLPPAEAVRADGQAWQLGQLGTAAMLVGIAETALALIVDYAKVRETFGRKIGAWQAVRHVCADMAVRVEAARAQLWFAAAALKEGRGDAPLHIDAAKHLANQAALANTDATIQLHGGIGVTDEHDAHLLMKHALLLSRLFGTRRGLLRAVLHGRLED